MSSKWIWVALLLTLSGLCVSAAASGGLVVPKRSAIIQGLNQQFRPRQKATSQSPINQTASLAGEEQKVAASAVQVPANKAQSGPLGWLGAKVQSAVRRQPAHPSQPAGPLDPQTVQSLYLDRHQQQLLAANPGELANLSLAQTLQQRQTELVQSLSQPAGFAQVSTNKPAECSDCGASIYKGYSLIELEVRSESDRRFVRQLYANLSAAINEQALAASDGRSLTVSPYVDIDFWSLRYALNDRLDIMVSPKSRAFMLSHLARARIKHRIKIDDIQARLDQQTGSPLSPGQQQQQQLLQQMQLQPSVSGQPLQPVLPVQAKSAPDSPLLGRLGPQPAAAAPLSQQQPSLPALTADAREPSGALNESFFFDNYQRLAEINRYLEQLANRAPEVARVRVIGRSSQGRYLRVLQLGYQVTPDSPAGLPPSTVPEDPSVDEPELHRSLGQPVNASQILSSFLARQRSTRWLGSIWLDGGTHAREWISPATVLYLAFRLADNQARCVRFVDWLRGRVVEYQQLQSEVQRGPRNGRRYEGEPATLDAEHLVLAGINDINNSLLATDKQVDLEPISPKTAELERSLDLVARQPQLVASEHGCDLQMEQLLRSYTFHLMPVLNPDGYEYSHTHNRLWRKTRSSSNHPIYRHFCLGADPNRNYDARHGSAGSSSHPCSQTYAGSVPFTEPETKHQSNFVYANRANMKMFISFHSYSQMILLPFSHSRQLAPDHKDLESVGLAAVKAIERTHGTQYRVGPSASILYTASGTASDWAYEKAGIKYSYTIELRDTGTYGFLLPAKQIVPTGEETFNGLLAMIEQMEKNEKLLSSKSEPLAFAVNPADYNHAPDLDLLRSALDQRPNSNLENILDGSNTWAAAPVVPSGVRDRKPAGNESRWLQAAPGANAIFPPDHSDPDAGYAFEGEPAGEAETELSPARSGQNLRLTSAVSAGRFGEARMNGRRDQWRRISQLAALTSSGRNSINSPPASSRVTTGAPRRESSDNIHEAR